MSIELQSFITKYSSVRMFALSILRKKETTCFTRKISLNSYTRIGLQHIFQFLRQDRKLPISSLYERWTILRFTFAVTHRYFNRDFVWSSRSLDPLQGRFSGT